MFFLGTFPLTYFYTTETQLPLVFKLKRTIFLAPKYVSNIFSTCFGFNMMEPSHFLKLRDHSFKKIICFINCLLKSSILKRNYSETS